MGYATRRYEGTRSVVVRAGRYCLEIVHSRTGDVSRTSNEVWLTHESVAKRRGIADGHEKSLEGRGRPHRHC